jgi:hypothetical protein
VTPLTRDTYVPRASTPLLDALGRGIRDIEKCLAGLAEGERPAKVIVVVITDGHENASREFRRDQIAAMVRERMEKDDWHFVYLSADLNAFDDALAYGIPRGSTHAFAKTRQGSELMWESLSKATTYIRMSDLEHDRSFPPRGCFWKFFRK